MTISLAAFSSYCLYRGWSLCSVYRTNGTNVQLISDFLFSILMIYLLAIESLWFLIILFGQAFLLALVAMVINFILLPPAKDKFIPGSLTASLISLGLQLIISFSMWILFINY